MKLKKRKKNIFSNEKGSTLLIALFMLFIFAVIGSSVLLTTINNMAVSQRISEYEDTYYMAEANTQYALAFVREVVNTCYSDLIDAKEKNNSTYESDMQEFYPNIMAGVYWFVPLDFSEEGVTSTVTITIDPNTPIPTSNFGEKGNAVSLIIESIAESGSSRRVVHGVITIDDPDVEYKITTAPPMTDRRILAASRLLSTEATTSQENAIFCRGNVTAGNSLSDRFLLNHTNLLDTFTYNANNYLPDYLEWDLQYSKFPTNYAFEDFYSLFEASTYGTYTYSLIDEWFYETTGYYVTDCAPIYGDLEYANKDIIDSSSAEADVDYYYTQLTQIDSRASTRYEGTASTPVRVYAVGNLILSGLKNLENCYIYAEGDITINITGHIEDSIIISNQGSVNITCDHIVNEINLHKLIKAENDINIVLDVGSNLYYAVIRSMSGEVTVDHGDSETKEKIEMRGCYLHTSQYSSDAMIYLKNIYLNKSYCNAGKDLVLRNCSGFKSSFYAFGYTDAEIANPGLSKLYLGATSSEQYLDYNYHMQFSIHRDEFLRYMRGIIIISELAPRTGTDYWFENAFNNCDFTTQESIFVSDPRYEIAAGNQLVDLYDCRLIADREVLIEDVTMNFCYVFAGIRPFAGDVEYYVIDGKMRLAAVRGIYMRVDHTHNVISNSVFYSRGRMMYSQNTPETEGFPITPTGKVRVEESLFYSKDNFEYNGLTTSQGLDATIMKNNDSLCNDIIIMTEENVCPHEFYPSPEDFLFVGGNMEISDTLEYTSDVLADLYGISTTYYSTEVQAVTLYKNYFEQKLNIDEIFLSTPSFIEVFVYEDIYEKTEEESGG